MAWQAFGTLAAGNQNLSLFDTLTAEIAKTVIVPCTATGTNTITLTGTANAPAIPSYSDLVTFSFLAANTSTGNVQALFTGLATLNVYLADGTTQAAAGNLVSGRYYTITFNQALNVGAGGFYLGTISVPVGITSGMQLIQKQTASNSATIDFTNGIGATYGSYIVQIQDMIPVTDATSLLLRVSEDGTTWPATGYSWTAVVQSDTAASPVGGGSNSSASIDLGDAVSNGTGNRSFGGTVTFWAPSGTTRQKMFMFDSAYSQSGGTTRMVRGSGAYFNTTNAIKGVRFLMSSGNISAGTFSLYGMLNG